MNAGDEEGVPAVPQTDVIEPEPPFEPEPVESEDPLRREPLSPIPGHEREPESD